MLDETHLHCVREEIHLPNEILAIIINELAPDAESNDRTLSALASCRLASRLLYSLATPLLFSSMQLVESPWANRNESFIERATKMKQILTTSDFATSVHTLTLRGRKENLENWINGILISAILQCLPHIRTFILKSGRWPLKFTAIIEDFSSAFKALCRSPNLTTLDLDNVVCFPITFITACPNLQCLRFSNVGFDFGYTNSTDETSILQPYNLDSLEIDGDSITSLGSGIFGLFGDISFAKYFSRIKNLRLKNFFYDNNTIKYGWDIMLLASQSLTTLDLPWNNDYPYLTTLPLVLEGGPFELGRFPALRHFKIQMRIPPKDNITMLYFLNQLLSISSSTSYIETLEIIIICKSFQRGCEKDLFSSDAGWSMLDGVLSSEKFVSLKKIVLRLDLEIWTVCDMEHERSLVLPYVNTLFPTLRALTNAQRTLELHVEIKD